MARRTSGQTGPENVYPLQRSCQCPDPLEYRDADDGDERRCYRCGHPMVPATIAPGTRSGLRLKR